MKRYDVFISYRRDGGDMTATRLYDSIAGRRYRVFLDVKTLGPCEFDQRLIDVIKNCRDFVLVLSPGSLDRCWNEDDWVRREIECAIYNGVNIVPVLLPSFRFPENLPESIRRVSSHSGIEANPNFWDAFLDKLEGFLVSRKKVRWYLAPAAVAAAVAVAAAGIFVLKSAAPETYRQAELVVMTGEASFQKGKAFYDQKDYAQALPYLEKAAEEDHAGALDTLGDMFYNGYGVTQNYAQALRCYEEAETLGSMDKLTALGYMYMYAQGCEDTDENKAKGVAYNKKSEESGAYNNLGVAYAEGRGVTPDIHKAIEYYTKAAEMGNGRSMRNLGNIYYEGRNIEGVEIPIDYGKAFEWYIKAEEAGYEDVAFLYVRLGLMYRMGNGTYKSPWQAKTYFEKAIEKKDTSAMIQLGEMYEQGELGAEDDGKALEYYERAVAENSVDGFCNAARMHANGKGTAHDNTLAKEYYEKAVELDEKNTAALIALGDMYYDGVDGVTQDYKKALWYYEEAKNKGNRDILIRLGYMYSEARGCEDTDENKAKAVAVYRKSEDSMAYNNLGWAYEAGEGVTPDVHKAIEYYMKAAEMGNGRAMRNLGNIYYEGRDVGGVKVPEDNEKAFGWYKKAEEAGFESVPYQRIGWLYREGKGTEKDVRQAKAYFEKAIEKKNTYAMIQLGEMYEKGEFGAADDEKALEYYERAAAENSVDGCCKAAKMYAKGKGTKRNNAQAKEYYEKAIELDEKNTAARNALGDIYYDGGYGVTQDYEEALRCYEEAEKLGSTDRLTNLGYMYTMAEGCEDTEENKAKAVECWKRSENSVTYYNIGWAYENGKGVTEDISEAIRYYLKAAEMGYGSAMDRLGDIYYYGKEAEEVKIPVDYDKAFEWYGKAEEAGYKSVPYERLGRMYREGKGTRKNTAKAKAYFLKAVEKGNTYAMVQLGQMYEYGELPTDFGKALEYYEQAANLNDRDGNYNAGRMYDDGVGLSGEDDVTAATYYEKAIELKSGKACNRLAFIYYNGCESIPADKVEAFELYRKGAEEYAYSGCMGNLGIMYQYGHGTDPDYGLALEWYLKAAEEGNGNAAWRAGDMYRDGIGVPEDKERARELYQLAADLGDTEAQERLDELQ